MSVEIWMTKSSDSFCFCFFWRWLLIACRSRVLIRVLCTFSGLPDRQTFVAFRYICQPLHCPRQSTTGRSLSVAVIRAHGRNEWLSRRDLCTALLFTRLMPWLSLLSDLLSLKRHRPAAAVKSRSDCFVPQETQLVQCRPRQ